MELTNRTLQQGVGGERGRVEFIATTQSCSDINGNPDAFLCAPVFKQRGEKLWRARMEEKGEVQKSGLHVQPPHLRSKREISHKSLQPWEDVVCGRV